MNNQLGNNLQKTNICFDVELPQDFEWDTWLDREAEDVLSLTYSVWPTFLRTKPDIEITVPHQAYQYKRYNEERYFIWGIREKKSGRLIACINGICLYSEHNQNEFDQRGFRWALEATLEDEQVNTFCLTSATVANHCRSKGLAKALVNSAKQQTANLGFHSLLVPVRPTNKHQFPDLSMNEYLKPYKQNVHKDEGNAIEDDLYDPWIMLHLRQGAQLLNICKESMAITASIKWWEQHLKCSLKGLNRLNIAQGLVPLEIDQNRFLAIYTEPNVWMKYSI